MNIMEKIKKLTPAQICQWVAAITLAIGAVFMVVNTFANIDWTFYTGLAFGIVAAGCYIAMIVLEKKEIQKKLTDSSYSTNPDNKIEHERNDESTKPEPTRDEPVPTAEPAPKPAPKTKTTTPTSKPKTTTAKPKTPKTENK
jgi:outer membrane biosynthesis protein TonB